MALAQPCTGKPRLTGGRQSVNQGGRNGRRRQLLLLRQGLHPRTRAALPPPLSIDALSSAPDAMIAEYRASPVGIAVAAARPLNPVISAMFDRVKKREREAAVEAAAPRLVKRRISVKSSAGAHYRGLNLHLMVGD